MTAAKEYPALEVTHVTVEPVTSEDTVALADVVLNGQISIRWMMLKKSKNGLHLAELPTAHIDDGRLLKAVEEIVVAEYHVKTEPALQGREAVND